MLSYGCEIWGLEPQRLWSPLTSILFLKRTLRVRKSVPDDVILCELGKAPLQLFWQKMAEWQPMNPQRLIGFQ